MSVRLSSSASGHSSASNIDVSEILCNDLRHFGNQISQTLQSTIQGYASLAAFIDDFMSSDFGFSPIERAQQFGYFSLYEFLKSDYMRPRVRIILGINGDAIFQAIPTDKWSKEIYVEQAISYQNLIRRHIRSARISARCCTKK